MYYNSKDCGRGLSTALFKVEYVARVSAVMIFSTFQQISYIRKILMKNVIGEMITKRKKGFLAGAVVLFFLLPVFFGCDNGGPDESDPYDPVVNPFIGIWSAGGEYWEFRRDGTGGRAATDAGPFNNFSFFVHIKPDGDDSWLGVSSLVLLSDGSGGTPPPVNVTRYTYSIEGTQATLTGVGGVSNITLTRESGRPQSLNLKNSLIDGDWTADWKLNGVSWASDTMETNQWSLKYRADGTVKTYHHSAGHQFENAYALRGNTLVIYGQRRFSGANAPYEPFIAVRAEISEQGDGTWKVQELDSNFPVAVPGVLIEWRYTKDDAVKWKEE